MSIKKALININHAIKEDNAAECTTEEQRNILRQRVRSYIDRGEVLATILSSKKEVCSNDKKKSAKQPKNKPHSKNIDEQSENFESINRCLVNKKQNVRWDDIAGLEKAKQTFMEIILFPVKFPYMFKGNRTPWKGILLYGPPGTGKSFLAKAIATEVNASFFSVSSSDLLSKWLGKSEKLVRELFETARIKKPSIIFIDEIDSLCADRSKDEDESTRRIKSEFLVQMDGVGKDQDGILVLGATNMPWILDPAIRRRFEKRIYIPLPKLMARKEMFERNIATHFNCLNDKDFNILAGKAEGLSGADIKIVVQEALMEQIRKIQRATHFKKVRGPSIEKPHTLCDDMLIPCERSDVESIELSWKNAPTNKILEPFVTMKDMLNALETIKPSVNQNDIERFEKFTKEFGQEA